MPKQDICRNVFQYRTYFDPQSKWDDLAEAVAIAQSNVKASLQERKLSLNVAESVLDVVIEWKLYHLHKAAKKRDNRKK